MLPGILKILGQGGIAAYCIPSRDVLGMACVTGILKILGQGGIAAYCIPSWDVIGMACVTRDS